MFYTWKLTNYSLIFSPNHGNSLADQWLELLAFTAEDPGFIRGWETKIPQALLCEKIKKIKKPNHALVTLPAVSFHFIMDFFLSKCSWSAKLKENKSIGLGRGNRLLL